MEDRQNGNPQPGLSARFTARWQTIDKTQWAQIVIAGVGKGMPWYLAHKVGRGRLASTHAARVNVLTAFLFVWKEQSMDEQDKLQQPPPPEPTPWERFLVIAKEEALWLAHTLGMITVTLAIGRIISRLGLDMTTLSGGASWQALVNKALNPDKKKEPSDDTNKHLP